MYPKMQFWVHDNLNKNRTDMSDNHTLLEKLDGLVSRFEEVSTLITDPSVSADQKRYVKLTKEYKELGDLMKARKEYMQCLEKPPRVKHASRSWKKKSSSCSSRPTRKMTATPSSKSVEEPEGMKPLSSPETCSACTRNIASAKAGS